MSGHVAMIRKLIFVRAPPIHAAFSDMGIRGAGAKLVPRTLTLLIAPCKPGQHVGVYGPTHSTLASFRGTTGGDAFG